MIQKKKSRFTLQRAASGIERCVLPAPLLRALALLLVSRWGSRFLTSAYNYPFWKGLPDIGLHGQIFYQSTQGFCNRPGLGETTPRMVRCLGIKNFRDLSETGLFQVGTDSVQNGTGAREVRSALPMDFLNAVTNGPSRRHPFFQMVDQNEPFIRRFTGDKQQRMIAAGIRASSGPGVKTAPTVSLQPFKAYGSIEILAILPGDGHV